jgi:hypothetical protein
MMVAAGSDSQKRINAQINAAKEIRIAEFPQGSSWQWAKGILLYLTCDWKRCESKLLHKSMLHSIVTP